MKTPDQPIIEKTLNNEATPEEAREVVRWLATPAGQDWLSDQMDKDCQVLKPGKEGEYLDHSIPSEKMYREIIRKVHRYKVRQVILYAAAVVLPFLLIAGLYLELNSRVDLYARAEYEEVSVPHGEQIRIMFQDGSRVFLNAGSRLRYPKKFGMTERKVELEGEGWFEVAPMKKRPFIVDLKVMDITVLGTTFDTKAYTDDDDIEISLESGQVELNSPSFKTFSIQPGEKVVYNRATGRCQIVHPQEIKSASSWKENILNFADAPLSEVLATLSRTFNVTFDIEDKTALRYHYTLRTGTENLDWVIKELEKIAPVRFQKEGDSYKVMVES